MSPFFLWILLLVFPIGAFSESTKVQKVIVRQDQIVIVHTAIGIATILQVPDRPNSVVVGDQDAFKVEYLDQAITIKPLRKNAKTNLYVYTDYQRFNVQLVTGSQAGSDYVVYLENQKPKESSKKDFIWTPYRRSCRNDAVTLQLSKLGRSKDGILLIEFELNSSKDEPLRPEWFWLIQNGVTKPIQNLFLSELNVGPGRSVQGMIQVLQSDLNESEPLRIELRRKKVSYLTIPKVKAWK